LCFFNTKNKEGFIMSLAPVVESVVNDKVQNGDMFTAHDVTIEVRQRGHRASHTEVRDAVHDYYQRGGLGIGYSRTNISVPGGNPFLYHRGVDNPANYSNIRGGQSVQSGNQQTIAIPSNGDSDSDDDDDGTVGVVSSVNIPSGLIASVAVNSSNSKNKPGLMSGREVDSRKTLSLPAPVVRKVGFQTGQKVYAVASNDGVDVVDSLPPSSSIFGKYTVDCHNQVRLTQNILKRAGIPGDKYDLEDAGNKVVVKLHK